MKVLAVFFVITYFLRGLMFGLLGYYSLFIANVFWRFELYFFLSTLCEAPNIFYQYMNHYSGIDTSLQEKPRPESLSSNNFSI